MTVQLHNGHVSPRGSDRFLDKAYADPASGYGYTIFDRTGTVQSVSASSIGERPLPLRQIPANGEQFGQVYSAGPSRNAVMTARASDDSYFLVVSRNDPNQTSFAGSLIDQDASPFLMLVPFILATLALIVFVINATLRPLQRASYEASKIGPASTIARVTLRGLPSELTPLVTAFNGALDRLSKAYQFEKRLTADAAHELRTPLAVLRMRLESTRPVDDSSLDWPAVQRDFAQIDRLIAQLLDLARKEQGETDDRRSPVNLARTAREAAAQILPLVESAGKSLIVVALDPVVVTSGEADDLRDMLRNVIENAHTHGEGAINIAVAKSGEGQHASATIIIADEGRGVPETLRALMFERFRKGDASTSGAGLGLAIVRHVAEAHGGNVGFVDGPASRIQIGLPIN